MDGKTAVSSDGISAQQELLSLAQDILVFDCVRACQPASDRYTAAVLALLEDRNQYWCGEVLRDIVQALTLSADTTHS